MAIEEGRGAAPLRAGLAETTPEVEGALREVGLDPARLSIHEFGRRNARHAIQQPWARRVGAGILLWIGLEVFEARLPVWILTLGSLIAGLLFIQTACDAFITSTERMAARLRWDHYVAGTVAEILSTLPEFVVIAFVIPISPLTAFVIALITIYNNAFVFSVYSFFLPKDQQGKFLMPAPITEAGTQILIAGAAIGLILGLVMIAFNGDHHPKDSFHAADLIAIGLVLLIVFGVYVYKLVGSYAKEESVVADSLALSPEALAERKALVYAHVHESSWMLIVGLFLAGVAGAVLGGERVAHFAHAAIDDLGLNSILTALILAIFAGMSEYVILWKSHRKGDYGIALANAFGGITQVMFLVLPYTLIAIGIYQQWINPSHPHVPIDFSLSNIFLLLFLFPTFFVLIELLEEDHTLGILDTTIMTAIFAMLIVLMVSYGASGSP